MKTRITPRRFVTFGLLGTLAIGGLATAFGQAKASKAQFVRPSTKTIRELAGGVKDIKLGKEKRHGVEWHCRLCSKDLHRFPVQ